MHQSVNKRNMPTHHKLTGHARKKKIQMPKIRQPNTFTYPSPVVKSSFAIRLKKKRNYMSLSACLGKVVTYAYSWISDKSCTD